jgi:hypothetical protein
VGGCRVVVARVGERAATYIQGVSVATRITSR